MHPGEPAGNLSWYHDPLPSNCVADWVCPGGTGAGYPEFAHCRGPEVGFRNLAVFFHACSFDCLYCQNWQYRRATLQPAEIPAEALAAAADRRTSCICHFGGDPGIPYALLAFHPLFRMGDLPPTPAALARRCLLAAREAGVRNPALGNVHLLG